MRKRTLFLAIFLLLLLVMASGLARSLEWNELNDEAYGATVGARAFEKKIKELSGGKLTIDVYTNGRLGTEDESIQGMKLGTLDIFRGNASSLSTYGADIIAATGMPFAFTSMEEFEEMAKSDLGQELLDSVEAADCGFVAISWLVEPPRNLFITEKTYEALGRPETFSLDMLKNRLVRVPGTILMEETIGALGAVPVTVTYSELKRTLESGNLDAAENGIITYINEGFYEAAPYYITDAHTFGCGVILVSTETWNSLSEEEKGWMREAGKVASDACYEYNAKEQQVCYDLFKEKGITLLPVEDIEKWQDACKQVYGQQSLEVQEMIYRIQNRGNE